MLTNHNTLTFTLIVSSLLKTKVALTLETVHVTSTETIKQHKILKPNQQLGHWVKHFNQSVSVFHVYAAFPRILFLHFYTTAIVANLPLCTRYQTLKLKLCPRCGKMIRDTKRRSQITLAETGWQLWGASLGCWLHLRALKTRGKDLTFYKVLPLNRELYFGRSNDCFHVEPAKTLW